MGALEHTVQSLDVTSEEKDKYIREFEREGD